MISSLELARLCGVSQGTVDRALHNRPGVSEGTRAKVLALAEQHGYRPNPAVREVLDGRSRQVIGLIPGGFGVFFMDLMNALSQALAARDLRLLMVTVADGDAALEALEEFASRRAVGALLVPPSAELTIPRAITAHLPVATLVGKCRGSAICHIAPDEVVTGRSAVDYLHGLGHRRILHATYASGHSAIAERGQGYRDRCAELGLPSLVLRDEDPAALAAALAELQATAVFCHNDWRALMVRQQLADLGHAVPGEISVLGVDSSPSFNALCPQISSLAYPFEAVSAAAAAWLCDQAPPPAFGALQVVPRESTAARVAAD